MKEPKCDLPATFAGSTWGAPSARQRLSRFMTAGLVALAVALSGSTAHAVAITGNPSADSGWTLAGNSLNNGVYIRGAGNFGYDLYTTSFTVEPGSPLIALGYAVNDLVLGMGGKIQSTDGVTAGWGSAFTGDPVNTTNLTTSVRIVSKFGVSPSSWNPSTIKPNGGNGSGSTSAGDGGNGAVLLGTAVGELSAPGTLVHFSENKQYVASNAYAGDNISNSFGQLIYLKSGGNPDLLTSWETFLNVTKLATVLPLSPDIPAPGDRINQALQRSSNVTLFTDALAATPQVPEPSSLALAAMGALGGALAIARKARRSRG